MENMNKTALRAIVVAALYDFAGALTTRKNPITAGETHDASPMAQAVKEFTDKRGCSLVQDPPIRDWTERLQHEESMQEALHALPPARDFREDLTRCLNRWSQDSHCNMPDFVLADMLYEMLVTVRRSNARTQEWLGGSIADRATANCDIPLPLVEGATMVTVAIPKLRDEDWPDYTKDLTLKRVR